MTLALRTKREETLGGGAYGCNSIPGVSMDPAAQEAARYWLSLVDHSENGNGRHDQSVEEGDVVSAEA